MKSTDNSVRCLLLAILAASCLVLEVRAGEDKGFSFPEAKPEQVGMNKTKLEQAKRYALSAGGSGMIVRHGRVVLRWGDQKKRYDIKSATKSFGATMLGVAIHDGKIELDAPARRYHPTFGVPPQSNAKSGWLDEITIRHLATQTAGFDKPGGYEKLLFRPGTQWHYSDGGPNWLAECITLQYRRDLEDLMFERVFTPLGITRDDLRWRKNQYRKHEIDGIPRREFGAGIHANVEALARLGYLYLHNGCWQNKQILPAEFAEMASRPIESVVGLSEWSDKYDNASDHYSLLWWNNADGTLNDVPRDAYWAWGLYDSLIVVIPSLDLVVARGGERGKRLPREDGANHYDVLNPLLAPIAAAVLEPEESDKGEKEVGFVTLFDGKTFNHWFNPTARWSIQDGRMVFSGEVESGGLKREDHKLMSIKQYKDFILRFEFKIDKRANSGVAIRAPLEGDAAFVAMEIQIIDNHYWKGLKSWQKHGSIYGVVEAKTGHLKQPGQWNTQEILCQGSRVKVTLNGAVIVDVDLKDLPEKTLDGKSHPGLKRSRGHIGFLPHTKSSEYRSVRIKELHSEQTDDRFPFPVAQPEQVSMDRAKLESARKYAQSGGGSGCIIRGGRLIMAWGDQNQKYDIYSSTKSISVTALGLAIMDGKVNLHDKAKEYLPTVGIPPEGNAETGWLDELTLWHLATQTGGFEKTRGWCRQAHRPGTAWMYSDGGPNWLADCLTVTCGRDLLDVMNERIFEPLGITVGEAPRGGEHDLHWGFNNLDRPRQIKGMYRRPFGAGIHCNVQAMAKIGCLYLRRGKWHDRQIIPESFVSLTTNQAEGIEKLPVKDDLLWSTGASRHYGLLWWNNNDGAIKGVPRDAFWSWGLKESFIIVVPSLDLVVARAGDYWAPRNDPKRRDSFNNILKPFLLPICESVAHRGPYAQSAFIPRVTFSDLTLDKDVAGPDYASGDQWAGTWADDGYLYMGWGDGTGFGHRGSWRDPSTAFMGLARLEGIPPNHHGINLWGGYKPESQAGALYVNQNPRSINLKPADGLISINGTMYWYAERKSHGRVDCQLLTSTDYGRTWRDHGRFFEENGKFAFTGIIQFGQNYSDVPGYLGDYLYMFDGGTKAETNPHYSRTDMLLARIPLNDLLNRRTVEFFDGTPRNPSWTSDVNQAKPVFEDRHGVNAHVSCTYNKTLSRFILLTMHSTSAGIKRGFGIFESDRPWGPWSTVYYTSNLDSFVPGLTQLINLSLPSKWISPDGKSMWLVFSGRPSDPFYSFNLIRVNLDVSK